MEISSIVKNDALFTLDLLHPETDQPVGIKIKVRSAASDEAMAVLRRQTNSLMERQQRNKLIKAETVEEQELEKAVSYVASWDWGSNTYEGSVPDSSPDTVLKIMREQGWIYSQVVGAARSITNFTATSAKK